MEKYLVDDFDFKITERQLLKRLRLDNEADEADISRALDMMFQAMAVARPKYLYAVAALENKDDTGVTINGKRIDSLLVRKNLDAINRIIPYVATCGLEIEKWSEGYTDILETYWADEIKNMLLQQAINHLHKTVKNKYFTANDMSFMSPGSLEEWPLKGQIVLFDIIGDVTAEVGVRLTDSCLMIPAKSVSGFFFSSESHYENCRLCPLKNCPNRRAEYTPQDN